MKRLLLVFCALIFTSGAAVTASSAQTRTTVQAQEAERAQVQRPLRAQMQIETREGRLTEALQNILESGDQERMGLLLPAVQKARMSSAPSTPASGAANTYDSGAGGPAEFNCNSGNCACAGASDCVDLVAGGHCVEGTVGCNDYGCTCQEDDSDD